MQKPIDGAIKFMEENFNEHQELFEELGNKQNPHTLFIGCSDSRVVPNLITNSLPGDLFVVRNIANIVPPYRLSEDFLSATSAIEYALNLLEVKNVIVCGHSNCGGCKALYQDESNFHHTPNVKRWLTMLEPIKRQVLLITGDNLAKRTWMTERLNIAQSVQNLFTYPGVKELYKEKTLRIYGWHYIIESGEIFDYDIESSKFISLQEKPNYEKIYEQIFSDF